MVSQKTKAPLSPKIRTANPCHLTKLHPDFWGEGLGVRGFTDSRSHDVCLLFAIQGTE